MPPGHMGYGEGDGLVPGGEYRIRGIFCQIGISIRVLSEFQSGERFIIQKLYPPVQLPQREIPGIILVWVFSRVFEPKLNGAEKTFQIPPVEPDGTFSQVIVDSPIKPKGFRHIAGTILEFFQFPPGDANEIFMVVLCDFHPCHLHSGIICHQGLKPEQGSACICSPVAGRVHFCRKEYRRIRQCCNTFYRK